MANPRRARWSRARPMASPRCAPPPRASFGLGAGAGGKALGRGFRSSGLQREERNAQSARRSEHLSVVACELDFIRPFSRMNSKDDKCSVSSVRNGRGKGSPPPARGPAAQARSTPHGRRRLWSRRNAIGSTHARKSNSTAYIRAAGSRSAARATTFRAAFDLRRGDGRARPRREDKIIDRLGRAAIPP